MEHIKNYDDQPWDFEGTIVDTRFSEQLMVYDYDGVSRCFSPVKSTKKQVMGVQVLLEEAKDENSLKMSRTNDDNCRLSRDRMTQQIGQIPVINSHFEYIYIYKLYVWLYMLLQGENI